MAAMVAGWCCQGSNIGVLADYCILSSKAKKTIESPKQAAETHTHTHTHTLQKTDNWQKSNIRPAETHNTQHNKKGIVSTKRTKITTTQRQKQQMTPWTETKATQQHNSTENNTSAPKPNRAHTSTHMHLKDANSTTSASALLA